MGVGFVTRGERSMNFALASESRRSILMSRPAENLPATARAIALLLSSTPAVQDAQPGVLHQLLEFSQRYTTQVLSDASVYAEHGGRSGKIEMDDVVLAVQARVGWEFGGRVPKEVCDSCTEARSRLTLDTVHTFLSYTGKRNTTSCSSRGIRGSHAPTI